MGRMLSPLDAAFLAMESDISPIQVGGLQIYQIPKGYKGNFVGDLHTILRSQAPLGPFAKRVINPLSSARLPRWEVDNRFDIDHHLRHLAVPNPGTMSQLTELVASLHSIRLDLHRPLWECYLIEGLEGNRFALYSKMHHAMIDGMASSSMLDAFISESPSETDVIAPWALERKKRKKKDGGHRAGRLRKMLSTGSAIVEQTRATGSAGWDLARQALAGQGLGKGEGFPGPFEAPKSPLNSKISNGRRLGLRTLPLSGVKEVSKALGGTLNDMILAVCAGALRNWLEERNQLPQRPLVASMPVSVRLDTAGPDMGNQIAYILSSLATNVVDTASRFKLIVQSTEAAKKHIKAKDQATARSMAVLGNTLTLLLKQTNTTELLTPPANLIISNVPGPKHVGYLMGAELEDVYPISVLVDGQAMNITILSYADKLGFGILGDREAFPDLSMLPNLIERAWLDLKSVADATTQPVSLPPKKRARTRRPSTKKPTVTKTAANKSGASKAAPRKTPTRKKAASA